MIPAPIRRHASNIAFAIAVTMVLPLSAAHAYLDAGSISMALQVTIGAIASALMVGKLYFHRIMGFLGLRKGPSDDSTSN